MLQIKNKTSKPSLLTATVLVTSLLVTACSDNEHEEIHAIDKVEEASTLARENAPEPEDFNLEVTEMPATDATTEGDTSDGDMMLDDAVTSEGGEAEAESENVAVTEDDVEAPESDSINTTADAADTATEVADEEGTIATE